MTGIEPLAGRSAIVTGAGGDIGRAIAVLLASRGARVAVVDMASDRARHTVDQIEMSGGRASAHLVDVRDAAQVERLLDEVEDAGPPASLIVAAAGVISPSPFLKLLVEDWRRTIDINMTGVFTTIQASARRLVERGASGAMVAVSSVSARGPRPDTADYAASKAGVISLVRSAAVALGPYGIRVNSVCPGVVASDMTARLHEARAARSGITVEESIAGVVGAVALGRQGRPDEIADVVAYLLGDESSYVTGQAINVCGGLAFD